MKKANIKKDLSNNFKEVSNASTIRGITLIALILSIISIIIVIVICYQVYVDLSGGDMFRGFSIFKLFLIPFFLCCIWGFYGTWIAMKKRMPNSPFKAFMKTLLIFFIILVGGVIIYCVQILRMFMWI